MIDFNDSEYGFKVDPKSPKFFEPHKTYSNITVNTVSIPFQGTFKLTTTDDTILEIMEFLGYVIAGAVSSYGNEYLMSRIDHLEHVSDETFEDSNGMIGFSKTNGGSTLNQFFMPFERVAPHEFYVGRCPNLMTSNRALSRMEGSIPYDDYIRYPLLLPLIQFKLTNDEIRNVVERAFPQPRPYGSLKSGVRSNRGVKLSERCAINADVVTYELHRNFNNWLTSIRADQERFSALLNDTFITRAMFAEQVRDFQFSHASNISVGAHTGRTDITIFPHNAMYVRSFKVAERAPGFVTHTFSKVLNLINKPFKNFPFMSFEKATSVLTTAVSNMTYPGLGPALSASSLLINSTSPRVLSLLASLNIMARYTNFKAAPIRYDTTKNPAVFALTFLGLVVKKYMFSNLWMWNQVAWVADVHQFLMSYFPDEYGPIFHLHGYGFYNRPGGGREVVTEITGLDKLTCPITTYTINRPPQEIGLRNYPLLSQVMTALSLIQWNGIPYALPPTQAEYRVANRQIQVPGTLYGPKTSFVPRVLPIALLLINYLKGPVRSYYDKCKKDSMVKQNIAAYDVLIKSFEKSCESFAYYFHIIYNVVVTKAALIPDLIYDDICAHPDGYNHVLCYYDAMSDMNPQFPYSTPQSDGLRIVIPGINEELIGHNLTGQAVNILLCAYNPMAAMQGMNMVTVDNLNVHKTFGFLYESTDSVYIISDYVDQLLCRQKYVECLQLVGELSINDLIQDQPDLTAAIRSADQLSGVTAAVWVLLSNIVNNDNQDISSFLALQKNIFGDNLEDPRVYRLTIGNLTPVDDRGRTNTLEYIDPVRPHVRTNINLVVDRVIGRKFGLRKISQGMTYSMVPFRGCITWSSRHQIPGNYVTIGKSKKRSISSQDNKYEYYEVSVSILGGREEVLCVGDPDELYQYVCQRDPTVYQPAYTVVLDNPVLVTNVMTTFLTEAVNKLHCVVVTQQSTVVPTYNECSSAEANETAGFTQELMDEATTLGNLKLRKPGLLSTMFETGNVVSQRIVKKMLPYNESGPIVVYKNLHTTAVGVQTIEPDFYPVVVENDDHAPAQAIYNDRPVDMLTRFPISFTTVRNVYVAPPLATLSVFIEPA